MYDYINEVGIKDVINKKDFNSILYNILVIILVSLGLIGMILFKKNMYYKFDLLVVDNNKVILTVLKDDLETILKNDTLIINEEKMKYSIDKVELVNDYKNYYYQICIKVSLGKFNVKNSFLKSKILLKEENYLNYFIRIIKGG